MIRDKTRNNDKRTNPPKDALFIKTLQDGLAKASRITRRKPVKKTNTW